MSDPTSARKDVADLLENLAQRIRSDPAWGAGQPTHEEGSGITVYAGPDFVGDVPALGVIDILEDPEAITVTAETRNADANSVHVTLADDKLFIGLGDGQRSVRRDVKLPGAVDEDHAVATFRNGVLDIVLPRRRK